MLRCGLLGGKLGHSYSPRIHSMLGRYEYRLYEKTPRELEGFIHSGEWDGLNVTIPYKKAVLPYCSALSETAARTGSVNTLLRLPDGGIYGDNTDAYGFEALLRRENMDAAGKKALVLGSGGASATVCEVLRALGAAEVTVISRSGPDNYENLDRRSCAQLIVNATPVGMWPNNGAAALSLTRFGRCEGAVDLIYNPARTALLLEAEKLGIPCANGLYMLAAQAKRSAELFCGADIPDGEIERIYGVLRTEMLNVILIGMPGCGKSAVARLLAGMTGRRCFDADDEIVREEGRSIPEIFARGGEEEFRRLESAKLLELGKLSGAVIAAGGGCVTREDNYPLLHQNGTLIWLRRSIEKLPTDGRPISQSVPVGELYARREPIYARWADVVVQNDGSVEDAAKRIIEKL